MVGISQSGQSPDIVSVLEEGKRQGRPTLAITNDSASPLAAVADHVIELPEWLSPLAAIVPGQLLALRLTQAKGFDPDRPRGLHKVTRTL